MTNIASPAVDPDKTLELLWTRVRQRGDMPGFSKVVSAIVGAMHGEDEREFSMTKTVLSDPTLTQRVLRLANSAMYAAFGQGINTVSKAVIVLGTETIGHLALGLKLIDGLAAASDGADTRSEMEKAVLAGQIARQVASSTTRRDTEEVVVCSILHSLGRLMVSFYLPEEWAAIQSSVAENGVDESEAARTVLGLGLDEIGRLIGKRWGFPASLIDSLKNVPPPVAGGDADGPLEHTEWLAAVSTMSSHCADVLCERGEAAQADLARIAGNYAEMLGLEVEDILGAVEAAHQVVEESRPRKEEVVEEVVEVVPPPAGKPADSVLILQRGVADMRNQGLSVNTGQLTTMALETVYQGLGFTRAVAFLRNHKEGRYTARMGFGERTQELLPRLHFNEAYEPDVFHAALANDKMIFVEDARAPGFVNKLPRWWRENFQASRSFVVLPLMLKFHPMGFLYGDWDDSCPPCKILPNEVVLLDELRALMVKAIEHRIRLEPAWARTMY